MTATRADLALLLACLTLSACARTPAPAPTVSYYRAHAGERRERVRACVDDPARARQEPSCINALAAEKLEGIGSLDALPPLKLSLPEKPAQSNLP
ncbi:MAG: EexN family lipoprotein [Gammaproteobacteria bacterium]